MPVLPVDFFPSAYWEAEILRLWRPLRNVNKIPKFNETAALT